MIFAIKSWKKLYEYLHIWIWIFFYFSNLFLFNFTKQRTERFSLSTFTFRITLKAMRCVQHSLFTLYILKHFYKVSYRNLRYFIKWKVCNIKLSYFAYVNSKTNDWMRDVESLNFVRLLSKLNRLKSEINTKRVTIRGGEGDRKTLTRGGYR